MRRKAIRIFIALMAVLLVPFLVMVAEQTSSLLIDGPQGKAKVIQVQGKNYVEIDEVARITGGSLRFTGNEIILALPSSGDASVHADAASQPVGLSRPFLSAGIEGMREILEWHAALKTGIERGYPLSDVWFGNYRRQIQSTLKQAEAAASTDADQKALPLLINEFNTMSALTDKYLQITVRREYLAPDSLNSDPLDKKLLACWHSLESMASSNQLFDDGACH
jgi:biopolymer transport protein ExbD